MKVGVVCFVAGLILGVGVTKIFSEKVETPERSKPEVARSSRVRRPSPEKSPNVDVEAWHDLKSKDLTEKMSEAEDGELKEVIEKMVSQGDPFKGMASEDRTLVKAMLKQMVKGDLEGTVAWISSQFQDATRQSLIVACVEESIEMDFDKSLEFAEQSLDGKIRGKLAGKFLYQGLEQGVDQALSGLTMMPDERVGGKSGVSVRFSDDFDFAEFGAGALEIAEGRNHKDSFSKFPSSFLEEWARRDPGAALKFYNEHSSELAEGRLPFNYLGDLAEGYLGKVDAEEGAAWVEGMLGSEETTSRERSDLMSTIKNLKSKREPILKQMIDRQVDAEGKANVAGDFYDSLSPFGGGEPNDFRSEILGFFPDAESRMSHVMATARINRNAVERIAEDLKALGHSEDEVARFREAAKK